MGFALKASPLLSDQVRVLGAIARWHGTATRTLATSLDAPEASPQVRPRGRSMPARPTTLPATHRCGAGAHVTSFGYRLGATMGALAATAARAPIT